MNSQLVTIIMATYNRGHFILEALQSIQNQTYINWECIIIDDGGTDNTKEVIANILIQDNRFQYLLRTEKYIKGLPGSRNYGLDLVKGDFIIFFDDDDFIHPDNLKIGIEVFNSHDIYFCHYQKKAFFNEIPPIENKPIDIVKTLTIKNITDVVTQKTGLASCTVIWKKECFKNNRFVETLQYAEEWECYTRIISQNFKGIIISNVLYYNRKHLDSNTGKFYNLNPIQRKSKSDAVLLVFKNLLEKKIATKADIIYFVTIAYYMNNFGLFKEIMLLSKFSRFKKLTWFIFYKRLYLQGFLRKIKNLKIKKQ
jgi:GalNAc5-diNAcBac-PP-undecaprenol beta-1,3-glucosyltransferase